jgi:hypothetical protein
MEFFKCEKMNKISFGDLLYDMVENLQISYHTDVK